MNIWTLIFRLSLAAVAVAIAIGLYSLFAPEYERLLDLQEKKASLAAQNADLDARIHEHQNRQQLFRNDPRFVERLVREQFGMVRETETIYKIIRDAPPAVYAPPAAEP